MWEESFCCYVLWESPFWRMYGQAGFLRADTTLLCRSTAQAATKLPAEEFFCEKPELSVVVGGLGAGVSPPPFPAQRGTIIRSKLHPSKKETTEPAIDLSKEQT